jgi:hypothetical protein
MAWLLSTYRLQGVAPFIHHNGVLADKQNPIKKAIDLITAKKKKTDADHLEIARLEFAGGLYMGPDGPILPSTVMEAAIQVAARKTKEGLDASAAMFVPENTPLEYDGPRTVAELWDDERFRFSIGVRIQRQKVQRMRARFFPWAATVGVSYENTIVNKARVDEWIVTCGRQIGIGDWHPRNGRFEIIEGLG